MSSNDLELNTEVIHDNDMTYLSLLDKYDIDLFSNKHLEEKKKFEEQLTLKEKNVMQCVFLHKSTTKDMDKEQTDKLFSQPLVIVKQQEYVANPEQYGGVIATAFLMVVVFTTIFVRYFKYGRRKKIMEDTYE